MRLSIRRKIVLFVVMPLVGLYALFAILNAVRMRQETTANVENRLRELAYAHADRLDSRLREVAQIATMTATFVENNPDLNSEQIYTQLQANLELSPLVYGSAVCFEPYQRDPDQRLFACYVYRDGDVVRRLDPTPTGYDYTEEKQEYWHAPRETGKASWTAPYIDDGAGDILMCTYSVPFFRGGDFLGIATVDIPLEPLRELADIKMPRDYTFCVLTRTGKYVYCTHADHINRSVFEVLKEEHGNEPVELARAIASGDSGAKKLTGWTTEARQWVFYTPIHSAQWGFAVGIPEKVVVSGVREQFYRDLAFLAASLPLVIFTLWLVSVWISRPIVRLCNVAGEIGRGNMNTRAEVAGNDEIGLLADSFNEMVARLAKREEALRESEERYRAISEDMPVLIARFLPGSEITYVNDAYSRYFEKTPDELVGSTFLSLIPEADRQAVMANISALTVESPTHSHEHRVIAPNGEIRWQRWTNRASFDAQGKAVAYQSIGEDVTERKRAEEALRESEERFRSLFENAPIGYQSLDENGNFIELNQSWCKLLGYTKEEVLGRNFSEFIHPDFEEHFKENFPKFKSLGYILGVEFEMIKKDGSEIIVAFNGKIGHHDDGSFKQTHCVLRDITEQKRAEEALLTEKLLSDEYINSLPGLFYVFDEQRFVRWNREWEKVTGYNAEELGTRYGTDFFEGEDRMLIEERMRQVFREGAAEAEAELVTKDGTRIPYYFTGLRKVFDGKDHLVGLGIDITDRRHAQREREELIAKLEAQNAELERFTYTVSHDLKSPLITIKGYVGMLRQDLAEGCSETIGDDLARISNAADNMGQLLKELLELSRIGRAVNPLEDVSLEKLAREARDLVYGQAEETGVQVEISPDLPVVYGDRLRLLEVLQNLIDNAVKYMGDQSQPRVDIGSQRDGNQTICYVRDNGIGIDPCYHERVFGLFDQLDQKMEGSGIGLALVKRIVEVHGGRIWVESEGTGHGATFCFTIAARSESTQRRGTEPRMASH